MTPLAKNIIIWSSVAVVLGVGGYLIYDSVKKKREEEEEKKRKEEEEKNSSQQQSSSGSTSSDSSKDTSNENTSSSESTDKQISDEKVVSEDLKKAIKTIVAKAYGNKAKEEYLVKTSPVWVKQWAWSINNSRKAFVWGGKTWRTKTGEKLLDYDPIGKFVGSPSEGTFLYKHPYEKSEKTKSYGNVEFGKVRAITFDGKNVWFYTPDKGSDYKWGKSFAYVKY